MKCAIFCLWALCAIETVFADNIMQDLENLHTTAIQQMYKIVHRLRSAITGSIDATKRKGTAPEGIQVCWNDYFQLVEYFDPVLRKQCDQCNNDAIEHKKIKLAKKCYRDILADLENQANIRRTRSQMCIAKFIHEGSCRKRTQKQ